MTAAQTRAIDAFLPSYQVALPASAEAAERVLTPAFWGAAFGRSAPLAIEIGFGNGAALVSLAQARPAWNCLGVDVYRPGFGALFLACEREGIGNVRVVETEGLSLLQRLAGASVRLVHVFFPDPWPKARHHKRRLVNAEFAAAAGACLAPDGVLRLATDWPPYAEAMREVLGAAPMLRGGPAERPEWRPVTPFEAKGIAGGRPVCDLVYRRVAS